MRLAIAFLVACGSASPPVAPHRFAGDHVELAHYAIYATNDPAPSFLAISIGIIPHDARELAELADRFELVDGSGATSPVAVESVRIPLASAVHAHDGSYPIALHPSVVEQVELVFAKRVRPPAAFLRVHLDGEAVDVPLRFTEPVTPRPSVACDRLAACCADQTLDASRAKCGDIARLGRQLGADDQCDDAANDYCR